MGGYFNAIINTKKKALDIVSKYKQALGNEGYNMSTSEETALRNWVASLKTMIYADMTFGDTFNKHWIAMWPMLGSTAASQSLNFFDPTKYRLTFTNTTHAANKVIMNGTNAYMNTNMTIANVLAVASGDASFQQGIEFSYYSYTEQASPNAGAHWLFGTNDTNNSLVGLQWRDSSTNRALIYWRGMPGRLNSSGTQVDSFTGSTISSSRNLLVGCVESLTPGNTVGFTNHGGFYRDSTRYTPVVFGTSSITTQPSSTILIGAGRDTGGNPVGFSKLDCGFAMICKGAWHQWSTETLAITRTMLTALGKT